MNALPTVRLRALEKSDLPSLKVWRNEVIEMMREYRLINDYHEERWFEDYCRQAYEQRYPAHLMFGIENDAEALVGVCGLTYIDWHNRRAELSIYMAPHVQGRRYGRAALRELHCKAFCKFGLMSIWLEVHDWNPKAMRLYQSEGYKKVGIRRDARFMHGQYWPTHEFDLTAGDYFYACHVQTATTRESEPDEGHDAHEQLEAPERIGCDS